jgi:hypothetical protein
MTVSFVKATTGKIKIGKYFVSLALLCTFYLSWVSARHALEAGFDYADDGE